MAPKSNTFSAPERFSSRVSSSAPAAASLHTKSLRCCSSACTAAAARVCSPSPYSAGARLVRNSCTARCSCCGVLLCSATSVSAPRLRQCTVPCQVSGRAATAFCTVCSGTPNSRSTQPAGRSSLFVMTHPPCGRRGRSYSARRVSSKAVRAAGSCCALSASTCVPAGVLPCASRSAISSAVCAARARMSARSGRETNSFFT